MSGADDILDQPVPFLRHKEKDFVLLDGAAERESEVVAADGILFGFWIEGIQHRILGIEQVVAAEIIGAAVKIIRSRFGHDGDNAASGSTKLGVIAVPLDFELLNRIKGRIDEDGAVRAYIDVVGAIHKKEIGIRGAAADGDVRAAVQAFLVIAEAGVNLNTRNQRQQLGEAAPVER